MVRAGTQEDIREMQRLGLQAMLETKTYRDRTPELNFLANELLTNPSYGCWVSYRDKGRLTGMLIGQLQRGLFFEEIIAANVIFYVEPRHRRLAPLQLLAKFEGWANANKAVQIHMGTSGGINMARNARFFSRLGYEQAGVLYLKEVEHGHGRRQGSTADAAAAAA